MRTVLGAALVIARRDFIATVWSRTFLLFLLAPMIAIGFGVLIGQMTEQADVQARQPNIAIVMDAETQAAVTASRARFAAALGELELPTLIAVEPDGNPAQAERLLASSNRNISAVLTGTLAHPTLTGPAEATRSVERRIALIIDEARRAEAMGASGIRVEPIAMRTVTTENSAGSVNLARHLLARAGQGLIFILTLLLAGMLLSNLVEEKSNKVIEVLAAAVPLDAVFLGKLIAMLGVCVVGILVWGGLAASAYFFAEQIVSLPSVTPAVGWPAYCILLILYFAANYMLLGSVFLGIGGQASNVREVQTLSMPITFAQVMVFALGSAVVGDNGGTVTMIAAIFPLSSPIAMVAIAAQSPTLWWHLAALAWQLIWVALIIRISARMFRLTVLKSASRGGFFDFLRKRKRDSLPAE